MKGDDWVTGPNALYAEVRSLVMLRWILPVRRPYDSARQLIASQISPAVRRGGWLSSPGTTHHVSDEGGDAWLTVVTHVDDATEVQGELADLLQSVPTVETAQDALLTPGGESYRSALQCVTHVGLDLVDARAPIPLSEYEAFETPSESTLRLVPFLTEVSVSYRQCCSTYDATEAFWLAFFQQGPASELLAPGRGLWNLAG